MLGNLFGFIKGLFFEKKLTKQEYDVFKKYQNKIEKLPSPSEKIVGYDKLYHNILKKIGYSGSFGEILKKNPKQISNIDEIWKLHKLRNSLVHDIDASFDNLDTSAKKYHTIVTNFLLRNMK